MTEDYIQEKAKRAGKVNSKQGKYRKALSKAVNVEAEDLDNIDIKEQHNSYTERNLCLTLMI